MKFGKLLRHTAMASAVAVLAMGAVQSMAAENVAFKGHISASVASVLNVTEVSAMKFGNFKDGVGTVTLGPTGTRSKTGTVALLHGGVAGVVGGDQETGSQAPGFFDITTDGSPANLYITFADSSGNIVDTHHPSNFVQLLGPAGDTHLTVDTFTFAEDDKTTGYSGTASQTDAVPAYGDYVAVNGDGTDRLRVGATLHDSGGAATGRYTGTYYIMVSY